MHAPFERFSLIFLGCAVIAAALAVIALFAAPPSAPPSSPRSAQLPMAAGLGMTTSVVDDPEKRYADFDLDAIAAGAPVPRTLDVGGMPWDGGNTGSAERVDFVRRALPLVLFVNEEILADRSRLWKIRQNLRAGEHPAAGERLWVGATADRYGVARDALVELTRRVDAVPPSLALAIVAIELERRGKPVVSSGNAVPAARSGTVAAERPDAAARSSAGNELLFEAVRRHVHGFNTSPGHEAFRMERERLRQAGVSLDGAMLVETLPIVQSQAWPGAEALRKLIADQRLDRFDAARLQPPAGPM